MLDFKVIISSTLEEENNICIFREFYLQDDGGNAHSCNSNRYLVSKFQEINNNVYAVGSLSSFSSYDGAKKYFNSAINKIKKIKS